MGLVNRAVNRGYTYGIYGKCGRSGDARRGVGRNYGIPIIYGITSRKYAPGAQCSRIHRLSRILRWPFLFTPPSWCVPVLQTTLRYDTVLYRYPSPPAQHPIPPTMHPLHYSPATYYLTSTVPCALPPAASPPSSYRHSPSRVCVLVSCSPPPHRALVSPLRHATRVVWSSPNSISHRYSHGLAWVHSLALCPMRRFVPSYQASSRVESTSES